MPSKKKIIRSKRGKRPHARWKVWTKRILSTLFIVIGIPSIYLAFVYMQIYNEAGDLIGEVDKSLAVMDKKPSVILSADNKILYRVSSEYRDAIQSINEVPKVVIDATLAAEDKRFYKHKGVDFRAIIRILFTNVKEGRMAQGASTLEMQLAKRLTSKGEKTYKRKLRDIALAKQMQRRLTKDQILVFYLNQVFYGNGAYGIKAAAQVYLGKRLDQLTISDAAMLARCVRQPSRENPFVNLPEALKNRDVVLETMRGEKWITEDEYQKALKERPKLRKKATGSGAITFAAPYFVQYVLATIKEEMPDIDLAEGGYTIHTTLDTRIQSVAEKEVRDIVHRYRRQRVTTAAFVLMDADGKLLAVAGGVDFKRNQYNVVTQGHRQPGSSFKPFVYATALENDDIGPHDSISNEKLTIDLPGGGTYTPKNSNNKTGGSIPIRTCISMSINIPAVRVIQKTGPETVVAFARRVFGFKSKMDPVYSLALGSCAVSPLEMAQGYSVFLLRGDRATPYAITKVVGPDGGTIRAYGPNIVQNVLSRTVAEEMDGFLRGVVTGGTASRFSYMMPKESRGKTGTTSDNRDAWFCGYCDNLVGIGWVGNEHKDKATNRWVYDPMSSSTFGGTVTVQMWAKVMKKAYEWVGRDFQPSERKKSEQPATAITNPDEQNPDAPKMDDVIPEDQKNDPAGGDPDNPATTDTNGRSTDAGTRENGTTTDPGDSTERPKETPKSTGNGHRNGSSSEGGNRPAQRTTEYVEIEICADSHQLASAYCPETVVRRFEKGKQPRRRCRLHGPKN